MTPDRLFFGIGALLAGLSVALGAFGAHGLRNTLSPEDLVTFETGARYQMYHALALLAVAWAYARWEAPLVHALRRWNRAFLRQPVRARLERTAVARRSDPARRRGLARCLARAGLVGIPKLIPMCHL